MLVGLALGHILHTLCNNMLQRNRRLLIVVLHHLGLLNEQGNVLNHGGHPHPRLQPILLGDGAPLPRQSRNQSRCGLLRHPNCGGAATVNNETPRGIGSGPSGA